MSGSGKSNRYCFVINSHPDDLLLYQRLREVFENSGGMIKYICGKLEIGEETGRRHFQGYVQLKSQQRNSWCQRNIAKGRFEFQRGTNLEARNYCAKEETSMIEYPFIEFGSFCKGRGERTDLRSLVEAIREGSGHRDLIDGYPNEYARYTRFVDRVMGFTRPEPHPEGVEVHLHYGNSQLGKTRLAEEENPGLFIAPLSNGTMWLDGYDRHECVLLDDFAGSMSKFSLTNTLRLLDRYPVPVPIKGSFVWWIPKKVIVTTNIHPFKWYNWKDRENQYHALHRRFTKVLFFQSGQDPEEVDEEFFYDNSIIWPTVAEPLYRELPINPNANDQQLCEYRDDRWVPI